MRFDTNRNKEQWSLLRGRGSSVGGALDSWWGVLGSISAVTARSRTGWVGDSIMWPAGLPALSHVWQHVKLEDVSLRTRPRYSLVADEDVKKPNERNDHF